MKKKSLHKQSAVDVISIEPASTEGPLTAFLALFTEKKILEAEACGKLPAGGQELRPEGIHNRERN